MKAELSSCDMDHMALQGLKYVQAGPLKKKRTFLPTFGSENAQDIPQTNRSQNLRWQEPGMSTF